MGRPVGCPTDALGNSAGRCQQVQENYQKNCTQPNFDVFQGKFPRHITIAGRLWTIFQLFTLNVELIQKRNEEKRTCGD
jgi:hypothetical protein